MTLLRAIRAAHSNDEGHAMPAIASLAGAAGSILLGIGAANDSGALAIAGGIIAGVGFLGAMLLDHVQVEWDIFGRLEKLEKK